jgi:hypothetical protein
LLLVALLIALPRADQAIACAGPPVPAYPGALQLGGPPAAQQGGEITPGHTAWTTVDSLLDVQMYHYTRLPASGWATVAQLPGQYPDQFAGGDRPEYGPALAALEFTRGGDAERVRITGDGGGFSVWLDCGA